MSKKKESKIKEFRKIPEKRRSLLLKAAEKKLGRPLKVKEEKYKPISIKLHPDVYDWAKKKAQKEGSKYQTVINETLLDVLKHKKSS